MKILDSCRNTLYICSPLTSEAKEKETKQIAEAIAQINCSCRIKTSNRWIATAVVVNAGLHGLSLCVSKTTGSIIQSSRRREQSSSLIKGHD